uniref:Uncharacterized protein n=1 Tax=Panagrolaimus sp. ES5 TaxID=591445 RepID=A0AC34FPC5_9BILA
MDQQIKKTKTEAAHAKGYVLFDYGTNSGVFVMHSIPTYGVKNIGSLPGNAIPNSQNIMCVTIDQEALHVIAQYIHIIKPALWSKKFPDSVTDDYLIKIQNGEFPKKNEDKKALQFKSLGGFEFTLFVKNTQTQVWDQLVGAYPANSFYVINWNGNINTERLQQVVHTKASYDNYEQEWDASSDHAKIAITRNGKSIVCVSDLNLAVR